jgi:hypothetical protein
LTSPLVRRQVLLADQARHLALTGSLGRER